MKVMLIEHTPNPDRICAAAAMLCHEPDDRDFLVMREELSGKKIHDIIRYVIERGHTSVIEHASFTFEVEGISRVLTHQLVRHRIASYSQQSQRHVKFDEGFACVIPPFDYLNRNLALAMKVIINSHFLKVSALYKELRKSGARPEDARFVLPNACTTKIVITMNARALHNFFDLRISEHAQWEIREMAEKMLIEVKKVAPVIFEKYEV